MKNGKKITAILLTAAVLVSLTGCGKGTIDKNSRIYRIGVCQLAKHSALDEATEGFIDAMTGSFGDNIVFDVQIADGSEDSCRKITEAFVSDGDDLIMANATAALQAASESTGTIPIVATSVTDYGTALGIRKWSGITGINATGTSDLASISQQEDVIFEIVPDAEIVGILYCVSESNSVYQADTMAKELETDGHKYNTYTVKSADEIRKIAAKAAEECDVIYIPTDNTMAASAATLKEIFLEAGVPMIAGEEGLCEAGVATLSIDYYNLGYKAGMMAVDILENDAEPGLMEIGYADEYTKKYNPDNASALGITVPDDYIAIE